MSGSGSSSLGSNSEIDDPGRDPKGLATRRATRSAEPTRTPAAASRAGTTGTLPATTTPRRGGAAKP